MFASGKAASASAANYIEDVFSTYLTTGTGVSNTQTVNNGNDLAGKGGLVWGKSRNVAGSNHVLVDTARGVNTTLSTDNTDAQVTSFPTVSSFLSNGFTATNYVNSLADTFAFWTFRKQPKFFDIVTYTGNGTTQAISHNLGSKPGFIVVKQLNSTNSWVSYHQSLGASYRILLNLTNAALNTSPELFWGNTSIAVEPTSTAFTIGSNAAINGSGSTYVAYLFAHDAGGFGLTGTDNVISCGSYTGNGLTAGPSINLGYEPQWIMIKRANNDTGDWKIFDIMRGIATGGTVNLLEPNTSDAEVANNDINVAATGFNVVNSNIRINASGSTYIYIAIRRGPMKVPTSGTSVFSPISASNAQGTQNTTGFPVDLQMQTFRGGVSDHYVVDRLRGVSTNATNTEKYLVTNTTAAEASNTILTQYWNNTGFQTASGWASASTIYWNFGRAPSFFDEVCYTGTGATINQSHNLGVPPELIFFKSRSAATGWRVIGNIGVSAYDRLVLQTTAAATSDGYGSAKELVSQPTSSVLSIGTGSTLINSSGVTFVAYLFATCAGVSKVGSYTGNGSSQTINCGFTSGARFVLIKATSTTGNWGVFDTARGITSGNDPCLRLNTTAAEDSGPYVGPDSTGFTVGTDWVFNESGVTYIFLAIA